mgnify:CR=1 FL=1
MVLDASEKRTTCARQVSHIILGHRGMRMMLSRRADVDAGAVNEKAIDIPGFHEQLVGGLGARTHVIVTDLGEEARQRIVVQGRRELEVDVDARRDSVVEAGLLFVRLVVVRSVKLEVKVRGDHVEHVEVRLVEEEEAEVGIRSHALEVMRSASAKVTRMLSST